MNHGPHGKRHLLCNATRSGLYRCNAAHLTALREAAASQGLAIWQLDLGAAQDERALLTLIGRELGFPPWYGHNWDALTDCLLDLSWREAKGYLLEIGHFLTLQTRQPDAGAMLLEVFKHCAGVWAGDGVPFWIVFDRTAPAGLPVLNLDTAG